MTELFIAGHRGISDAGFPDVLCPVLFLEKCNLHCPYCMNYGLVESTCKNDIPLNEVADYYMKKGETQILLSGGEPCFNADIAEYALLLKEKGFKVRLSTNGSFPDVLKKLIDDNLITYVAMDIKTSLDNKDAWAQISYRSNITDVIKQSIEMLENGKIGFEFRTTLFPPLVKDSDIISISNSINCNSMWVLQQFRQKQRLLGGDNTKGIEPYNNEQLSSMLKLARQKNKKAQIKYV